MNEIVLPLVILTMFCLGFAMLVALGTAFVFALLAWLDD